MDTEMLYNSMEQLEDWIMEQNEEALLLDGFEGAIVGMSHRCGAVPVVAYDRDKCIAILEEDFSKSEGRGYTSAYDEAEEYFELRVAGAYVGENTPVFVTFYKSE
jgi:hypothetical protein